MEGTPLTFIASATDPNGQPLNFSLDPGAPAGASIHPITGAFFWVPTETQGPGTYLITFRVSDNSSPVQSDSETISVNVQETNNAPVLAFIGNKTVTEGTLLSFTAPATDSDLPPQRLVFTLAQALRRRCHQQHEASSLGSYVRQAPSTNVVVIASRLATRRADRGRTITIVVLGQFFFIVGAHREPSVAEGNLLRPTVSVRVDLPHNG
jgi:hypothetical protein